MKKPIIALTLISLVLAAGMAEAKGVSCKSFNKQSDAQDYMDAKKPGWKKLDGDKDGEACECLSGGSRYDESVCEKWREKNGK